MMIDWQTLLAGGVMGTVLKAILDFIVQRRKQTVDASRVTVETSLLALNKALEFLSQRVSELERENTLLRQNNQRLETCVDGLEAKFNECAIELKTKISDLEQAQKATLKDLLFKMVEERDTPGDISD
jgi:predicted RNase H-like nuclease (RuvC/YqgF family)